MESTATPTPPPFTRLLPKEPGYTEDNGALLSIIVRALPADRIQTAAAATRELSYATAGIFHPGGPPDCGRPTRTLEEAYHTGHVPALNWYWTKQDETGKRPYLQTDPYTMALMASMAANGHHAALHLAHTMGYQWDPQVCDAAAGGGHLELVRWLRENGCPWGNFTSTLIIKSGSQRCANPQPACFEFLKWAHANGCPWSFHANAEAAATGRLDILRWAHTQDPPYLSDAYTCTTAAEHGHIAVIQWLRAQVPPCNWGPDVYTYAARAGHFEVIQWAHAHGCRWDGTLCPEVAFNGHLHILQWLRAQDPPCPWGDSTISYAAKQGHLEIVQWAHGQGCPWGYDTCVQAAMHDRLDVLQWVRAQAPPAAWDARTCDLAAKYGFLDLLQWARAQTPPCPWSSAATKNAIRAGHTDVAAWLQANGSPRDDVDSSSDDDY